MSTGLLEEKGMSRLLDIGIGCTIGAVVVYATSTITLRSEFSEKKPKITTTGLSQVNPEQLKAPGLADAFKFGFPGPINDIQRHGIYISSYDRRMRNPAWVSANENVQN